MRGGSFRASALSNESGPVFIDLIARKLKIFTIAAPTRKGVAKSPEPGDNIQANRNIIPSTISVCPGQRP